jgi:hypothetical protein
MSVSRFSPEALYKPTTFREQNQMESNHLNEFFLSDPHENHQKSPDRLTDV